MLLPIKGCALLATFILLKLDFGGDERSAVEGGVIVNIVKVKQAEVKKDEDAVDQVDDGPEKAYKRREVPSCPLDESGQYDTECNEAVILAPTKMEMDLEIDHKLLKHGGTTCHWTDIGANDCIPSVTCKRFHQMDPTDDKDDPRQEDYFEIMAYYHGSFGYQKYCGKIGPEAVTSVVKLQDFYVTSKLAADKESRGLKCTVTCNEGKVHGNALDENSEPEVNENYNYGRKPNGNRIVGGEDFKRGELLCMSVMVASGTRKPFCGSYNINKRFILFAAHCFKANRYLESKEGAPAGITGWGLNSNDATVTQSILQKLDLPRLTDEECAGFYEARCTRRYLGAKFKEGGKDSCKGDPGGETVCQRYGGGGWVPW